MFHRIHKPSVLIATIAVTQAVCLTAGVLFFASWMRTSVSEIVYQQVLDDNVQMTRQLTVLVKHMDVGDIRENSASWHKLQRVIGHIQLPNDGFVCLTDARNGDLLCHPDFNGSDAPMAKTYVAGKTDYSKRSPAESVRAMLPGDDTTSTVTGSVRDYEGELQIIAASRMNDSDLQLNVHQKTSGVEGRIQHLTRAVVPAGLTVAGLLVAITTWSIILIVRRYDARLAAINAGLEATVEERTRALRKTRDAVVFGLAKLAESRDVDTGEHLERISTYVTTLAQQLEANGHACWMDRAYVDNLALASSLHDIGKVGIPDNVLLKPGAFTPEERAQMETHAALGGACLDAIGEQLGDDDFLQLSREIAYGHHEKWDGTGYPAQAKGEGIPVSARIVALSDVYDALRSRRPYKEPMPHAQARAIIVEGRGSHFDPAVVDAFLACESVFERLSDQGGTAPQAAANPQASAA